MTKYYCDKCGKEIKKPIVVVMFFHTTFPVKDIPDYTRSFELCEHCADVISIKWMEEVQK